MSLVEAVCEAFIDNNEWCRKRVPLVVFTLCSIGFLFSFIMATKSGYYGKQAAFPHLLLHSFSVLVLTDSPHPRADLSIVTSKVLDILDHFSSSYLMLLGGTLSAIVVGWLYPAEVLVKEVRKASGEDAFWLPFLWPHMIRYFTPAILIFLFGYNFVRDCMRPYNGYPQWALVCFGWVPCLIVSFRQHRSPPPLSLSLDSLTDCVFCALTPTLDRIGSDQIPTLAFAVPSLIWEKPSQIGSRVSAGEVKRRLRRNFCCRGEKFASLKGSLKEDVVPDEMDTVRSNASVLTIDGPTQAV